MNKQSGQAFDKAIKLLAFKSKLSTFNQLPFIVWGSSVGGSMAHGIASLYPEKTLACVANIKSTDKVETKCKKKKDLQAVPCLFITGSRDPSTAKHAPEIQDLYESNRNKKAPWALAACPESHGKSTAAENLAIRFFEAVVPLRRPKMGSKLTDVSTLADVWSGNNETHEVQQGPGEKQDSWLPNEEFAQYWNKNHKGGGMKH